jgi:putative Ca2+/H+ antiporter (TMEM165/GDT1 family)
MNLGTALGIFALMFILELPDKTFVAMIIMSTRARALMIFIGGASALVIQMGLSVGAGSLLTLVPSTWKNLIISLLFLGGAAYLLFVTEDEEQEKGKREAALEKRGTRWKEFTTAFVIVFVGEFGDLTQIQAANFEAKLHAPVEVFVSASLAMICVSFLGAYGGQALQRLVPLKRIRLAGGLIFAGLGLATLGSLVFA